ncbi:ATP-binding protein [Weizmannia sp. CD-2023]|uniref:ATP-binding protein n=1 Tax=Heyndrickxia TaxID=2837504 RepID=UPI002E1CE36B|nr:ATP-binding protein [Weizmannia sp. CD-2023]MED4841536.1 ATP-binding protein [Weizmannia sp. CD-2023]MED4899763.1 ATP-binding protein [Weizmannia sp. CD-2023]
MTNENRCIFADTCKYAGTESHCHDYCFPFRKAHGESGDGGLVGLSQIPKKYRACRVSNLPIKDENPETFEAVVSVCEHIEVFMDSGVGLYLYSTPNPQNPKGTGTGKTTSACTIGNTYLSYRIQQHIKGEREIKGTTPVLFVKMSQLQNKYNSQFRGTKEMQEQASKEFYRLKKNMIETDLLIVDDIGLRGSTEAFTNEFYEVIDDRATDEKACIFTSNIPLDEIGNILSEQIESRIYGSTEQLDFRGRDYRRVK